MFPVRTSLEDYLEKEGRRLCGEFWPHVDNPIGILFAEDGLLKIKTKQNEIIIITSTNSDDKNIIESLLSITAKSLLGEKK